MEARVVVGLAVSDTLTPAAPSIVAAAGFKSAVEALHKDKYMHLVVKPHLLKHWLTKAKWKPSLLGSNCRHGLPVRSAMASLSSSTVASSM